MVVINYQMLHLQLLAVVEEYLEELLEQKVLVDLEMYLQHH